MSVYLLLVVLASLSDPGAVPSTAIPAARALADASPEGLASGIEIAKMLNPEKETLAGLDTVVRTMLQKMLAADPNIAAMEKDHPGFTTAGSEAIRSTTMTIMRERLPILWSRMGAAYARRLSVAELRQTLEFYQSAAGQRLVQATLKGIDPSALVDKQIAEPDRKIEAGELSATLSASATKAAANATSEDRTALSNFTFTPLGLKVRELNPEMLKIAADWSNERDTTAEKRIADATAAAMAPFLNASDAHAKKAKR
ncbi:DUF2059 domain-containing protein [Sphingomonas sp. HMP6]|uniref:DUF2059 domain-containing protein n=1 Tax=Sphingomonas sp. HMP6 TaxID=1517551 RepID=UPI001596995B|nr:DUF2059 domain-containing protein [Sphingomonas sp. HMP6]BCA59308.1 hypothetical protein HMP06_2077 [Sphingomonas sp. HMP6]